MKSATPNEDGAKRLMKNEAKRQPTLASETSDFISETSSFFMLRKRRFIYKTRNEVVRFGFYMVEISGFEPLTS
ncbi:MAG: hypothetical protein J1F69_03190 [Clostridiales bacterium]|nr:hypothetical protein [Clostridiales bacterium]